MQQHNITKHNATQRNTITTQHHSYRQPKKSNRISKALEHCDIGEPMLWATRHGFQKYFLTYLDTCEGNEKLSFPNLIALAASEGHMDILKALINKYVRLPFPAKKKKTKTKQTKQRKENKTRK